MYTHTVVVISLVNLQILSPTALTCIHTRSPLNCQPTATPLPTPSDSTHAHRQLKPPSTHTQPHLAPLATLLGHHEGDGNQEGEDRRDGELQIIGFSVEGLVRRALS